MAWKIPRLSSMILDMIFAICRSCFIERETVGFPHLFVSLPCSLRNQIWQWKIHQHPQTKWSFVAVKIIERNGELSNCPASHVWLPDGIWKIGYSIPKFNSVINHPQTSRDPVLKVIDQFLNRKPWVFHISLAYPISEISCACPCRAEISPFLVDQLVMLPESCTWHPCLRLREFRGLRSLLVAWENPALMRPWGRESLNEKPLVISHSYGKNPRVVGIQWNIMEI
jgi:hypothetical protein